MIQERPTLPKEGRMAVVPQVAAGLIRLPSVSVPTENATVAAVTLAAGPAHRTTYRPKQSEAK